METWYVLANDQLADPAEVAPDNKGVLRHKSGVAVAMVNGVPRSRGVDPKEMRPEPAKTYKNRAIKTD